MKQENLIVFNNNDHLSGDSLYRLERIGNRIFNWIFSLFRGFRIYDIGSGLNVYRVSSLPLNEIKKWPNHIIFCIQLLFCFCSNKKKPRLEPISWHEKDQVSNAKGLSLNNLDICQAVYKAFDKRECPSYFRTGPRSITTSFMLLKQLLDFKRNENFSDNNIIDQKYKIVDFNQQGKQLNVD